MSGRRWARRSWCIARRERQTVRKLGAPGATGRFFVRMGVGGMMRGESPSGILPVEEASLGGLDHVGAKAIVLRQESL